MTDPGASLLLDAPVAAHLPGEPQRDRARGLRLVGLLVQRSLLIALLTLLTLPLWPLYALSCLVWGVPPNVPRARQIFRYIGHVLTVRPPAPGLALGQRLWLMLSVLRKVAVLPWWGLCWQLDELLYGQALDAVEVKAPLIEISAARSGSTQLARYLEEDPHLAAPSLLQSIFPYRWMWRLAPVTLGRFITPEQVHQKMEAALPREFTERHEGDPFRTDTFDGALFIAHLNHLSMFLGPELALADFGFGVIHPDNRELWDVIFVDLLDRIARKVLLHAGPGPDGRTRRFFVKGHFLAAAEALERRYPDGRFLTMLREPAPRIQSGLNFLRANPVDQTLGPVPWSWLGPMVVAADLDYQAHERQWFTQPGGARKVVLRFHEYVADLEGAMRTVYRECLDTTELPPHVPRVHPPRNRTNYLLNRSLAQVGIDEAELNRRAAAYVAWCRGEGEDSSALPTASSMRPASAAR